MFILFQKDNSISCLFLFLFISCCQKEVTMIMSYIIKFLLVLLFIYILPKNCMASSETFVNWTNMYLPYENITITNEEINSDYSYETLITTDETLITTDYGNPMLSSNLRDINGLKQLSFSLKAKNCNIELLPSKSNTVSCTYNYNYYNIAYSNSGLDIALKTPEDSLWKMNTNDKIIIKIPFKYYKSIYINSEKSSINFCPMNVEMIIQSFESSLYICAANGLEYDIHYEGFCDTTTLRLYEGGPENYSFNLARDDGVLMYGKLIGDNRAHSSLKSTIVLPNSWNYLDNKNNFNYSETSLNTSENKIVNIDFLVVGTSLMIY